MTVVLWKKRSHEKLIESTIFIFIWFDDSAAGQEVPDGGVLMASWDLFLYGVCTPLDPGGVGAYGFYITRDTQKAFAKGEIVGRGDTMSGNTAIYAGLLQALPLLEGVVKPGDRVCIQSDNRILVEQLSGRWQAKKGLYLDNYKLGMQALAKLAKIVSVSTKWISSVENKKAITECSNLLEKQDISTFKPANEEFIKALQVAYIRVGLDSEEHRIWLYTRYYVDSSKKLTKVQAMEALDYLRKVSLGDIPKIRITADMISTYENRPFKD